MCVGGRPFPTRHFDVDRLTTIELPDTRGRKFNLFSVQLVAGTNLECFQPVQAIEICDCELIDPVYNRRKSSSNRVKPAATSSPSSNRTKFAAHGMQQF